MNLAGQFLTTVGMELESIFLDGRTISSGAINLLSMEGKVNVTRDASVESYAKFVRTGGNKHLSVYTHSGSILRRFYQLRESDPYAKGYELIINPTEISDLGGILFNVTQQLQGLGDLPSERAAVHFHVGFANNLRIMRNLLKICLFIDPFLYRLGGMGGIYRGYSNNSAYARPLGNSCVVPISGNLSRVRIRQSENSDFDEEEEDRGWDDDEEEREEEIEEFPTDGMFAQIINTEKALAAEKIQNFWSSFGVFPEKMGVPKYHPARYTGCNFYAIPAHGTFEFRHFNQSLNPFLLLSIAKLLRGVVELSTLVKKYEMNQFFPQNPNEQLSMEDCANTMDTLLRHFREKEIENIPSHEEVTLIMDTVEESKFATISKIPVMTHIREYTIPLDLVESAGLNIVKKADPPKQVDIHTIGTYHLVP